MPFLRHRQRSISAVTRGRWIIPSRRTWDTQFSDAPEVTASSTGLMTVTCRTSPAPRVAVSSTGAATWDLGDVTSPATPIMMMRESGAADDAWEVVESGVRLVPDTSYEFVAVAPSAVSTKAWTSDDVLLTFIDWLSLSASLEPEKGDAEPILTRETTATVVGYAANALPGDDQVILDIASGEQRFSGARRISEGVWSDKYADGTPIPDAVLKGARVDGGARTNLFTESEFRNGLADAPVRGGALSATTIEGFSGALAFDGGGTTYAYKPAITTPGSLYRLSAFVEMTDGLSPSFGSSLHSSASNDFAFVLSGNTAIPTTYQVEHVRGAIYRVSVSHSAGSSTNNNGIVMYATGSARTFKVTGYQLIALDGLTYQGQTAYIPTTTTTVTRNADELTWGITPGPVGTLYAEVEPLDWAQIAGKILGDSTLTLMAQHATNAITATDGTNTVLGPAASPSGRVKSVLRWSETTNEMQLCVDGVWGEAVAYDGSFDGMTVGSPGYFGHVRNIKHWNVVLSNSDVARLM